MSATSLRRLSYWTAPDTGYYAALCAQRDRRLRVVAQERQRLLQIQLDGVGVVAEVTDGDIAAQLQVEVPPQVVNTKAPSHRRVAPGRLARANEWPSCRCHSAHSWMQCHGDGSMSNMK